MQARKDRSSDRQSSIFVWQRKVPQQRSHQSRAERGPALFLATADSFTLRNRVTPIGDKLHACKRSNVRTHHRKVVGDRSCTGLVQQTAVLYCCGRITHVPRSWPLSRSLSYRAHKKVVLDFSAQALQTASIDIDTQTCNRTSLGRPVFGWGAVSCQKPAHTRLGQCRNVQALLELRLDRTSDHGVGAQSLPSIR